MDNGCSKETGRGGVVMFESKIINDINGTYLIISSDEHMLSPYELKMFDYNDIKGFLPITMSRVNNNIKFHYKIMNYENLTKSFYNKTFNISDIKNIFQAITALGQRASEFLLNPDSILLNPEYIFVRNKEYLFCYLPIQNQSFQRGIRELMEYILERLDHSDQDNALLAYGLYQKVLKNNFTMEMLMEEFFKNPQTDVKPVIITPDEIETKSTLEIAAKEQEKIKPPNQHLSDIAQLEAELSGLNREDKKEKFSLHKFFGEKKKIFFSGKVSSSKKQNKTLILAEKTNYGSTQLLTGKSLKNQSGGKDILLVNFPIEVGNSSGDAKCVIDNQTVSRKHALLTFECGIYYVEDLGSTNGTFVNGSRIPSYEPIQIKEGDEISFANERFCLN